MILGKEIFVTCNVTRYICAMIVSFRSRGLKLLYEKDERSKIQAGHVAKVLRILSRLNDAECPADMNRAGYRLHQLSGTLKMFWSVRVDKNYRIIFRFIDSDVYDVDYLDYH